MLNPFGTCDGLYQRAFKGVILCLPTRHKVGGSGKALRNVGRTERKLETVHFRVLDIPFYPLLYKLHFTMAEYRPSIVIGLALAPLDGEAWCIATHEGPEQGQKKESWIGCAEAPEKVATCEVALRSGRVDDRVGVVAAGPTSCAMSLKPPKRWVRVDHKRHKEVRRKERRGCTQGFPSR